MRSAPRSPLKLLAAILFLVAQAAPLHAEPPADPAAQLQNANEVFSQGRYADAAWLYRALANALAAGGDPAVRWEAQARLAYALGLLGKREEAEIEFAAAMELAGGDPAREGWTLVRKGSFYSRQGKFGLAQAAALRAQELGAKSGDRGLEATSWYLLGETWSLSGRYHEAIAANEKLLELRRAIGSDEALIADAQNQIAIDYRHVGRHTEAAELLEQALATHRRLGSPEAQARVLLNLANVHLSTGDDDAAIAMLREALEKVEQTQNPRALALVLNGLGYLYEAAGNRAAAREHVERALEINRRIRQPYGETLNLLNLGRLTLDAGELDSAAEYLRAALALADEHGYGRERSAARAALAHVAARRGEGTEALEWADDAVRIADELGDPDAQFEAMEARAAALEASGSADTAGAYLEAIELLESWRGRLALGDLRMGVAEPRWSVYEGAIRVLTDEDRDAEAYAVAERARARLLLELMAERDASRAASSEAESLRRELREAYESSAARVDAERRAELDARIDQLTGELAALEARAKGLDDPRGAARYPSPASAAEVQSKLLREDRALLAFFWGERDVYGWWMTADEVTGAQLGPAEALAAQVSFLRAAVEQPDGGVPWQGAANAVYDALIAPLEPTNPEEILVVADGPMAHVPIEVLTSMEGGEPLGATARIIYGPSASVLLSLARPAEPPAWERSILVVGDPATGEGEVQAAGIWRDDPLAPLPHAAREARAVYRLFSGGEHPADLLLGTDASLAAWTALAPGRYRYLHFAAHARVSDRMPEQTHLVLAGGRLDLASIRALDLRTELVTLSACETGRGQRVRGEGLIGLPHAFLSAGARGVLVTLWRIEDEATADFMRDFYARLHDGVAPAEALHAVRRAWIADGESHPAHWAPFVLVGGL